MKTIKKQYILGFLLIFLFGVGLLIGGAVHYGKRADYIETPATVVGGVYTRLGDNGLEYQPFKLRYEVDGKSYETTTSVWFNYPLKTGDTVTIRYKKGEPRTTVVSNVSGNTISYVLMGIGGVLIVAGVVLTGKYLYDVNHGKKV